ncbi:hypothetical protein DKP78_19435, partial [Enterococcus faecium]
PTATAPIPTPAHSFRPMVGNTAATPLLAAVGVPGQISVFSLLLGFAGPGVVVDGLTLVEKGVPPWIVLTLREPGVVGVEEGVGVSVVGPA